jgi:uncharacterized SAM-binding protein YcdF (DUF218 family)
MTESWEQSSDAATDTGPHWQGIFFLAAVLTFLIPFAGGYVWFSRQIVYQEVTQIKKAEGIVVLTGGADRVSDGLKMLSEDYAERLLITGVSAGTSASDISKKFPNYRDAIECCVELGYKAQNTAGNAEEALAWVKSHGLHKSLIIVTSNYHMPRTLIEMKASLGPIELIAYPVIPERLKGRFWWNSLDMSRLIFVEYVKFGLAYIRLLARAPAKH